LSGRREQNIENEKISKQNLEKHLKKKVYKKKSQMWALDLVQAVQASSGDRKPFLDLYNKFCKVFSSMYALKKERDAIERKLKDGKKALGKTYDTLTKQ
jgi:hypothetical protein